MIYTVTLNPSIDYHVRLDQFDLGQVNRIAADDMFPGGKGINVSRILQRLGHSNIALGFIGGFTGDFISDALNQEGILNNFTHIEGVTRINIKLKAQEETEMNGVGPAISAAEIADLKAKLAQVAPHDLVVLSGSIPPSLPADFYNELIDIIKERQGEFVLDTTGDSLLDALAKRPLLVKPNHHELAELFNTQFNSIDELIPYGQELLARGAQNVIVSLGKDGSLLFTADGTYQVEPIRGQLKNSVGAGDSMIAGFLSRLTEQEKDYVEALRYGVAAGTGTAFSDNLATKETILKLLPDVKINRLV